MPGDVVIFEAGDVVAADIRICEAAGLAADESALTGESAQVDKSIEPNAADAPLHERSAMLFKGTSVVRGTGEGIVVGTGLSTEIGRITELVEAAESERSPLEKQLANLSRQLVWLTLALAAVITAAGLATGQPAVLMAQTAIALAVAAIPEGLPIVATLALARGMLRMAHRNALVENLSAVETLGATTLILTDKTGTLTENRMEVERIVTATGDFSVDHRHAAILKDGATVDPASRSSSAEGAARRRALQQCRIRSPGGGRNGRSHGGRAAPRRHFRRTSSRRADRGLSGSRGASLRQPLQAHGHGASPRGRPLRRGQGRAGGGAAGCRADRRSRTIRRSTTAARAVWLQRAEALAGEGLRVLAVASRPEADPSAPMEGGLVFLGLIAFRDPPRADVAAAISDSAAPASAL